MKAYSLSILPLLTAGLCAQAMQGTAKIADLNKDFAVVQREDGILFGLGSHYTTRFLDDRVEFVPHTPTAPNEQTLVLRARDVTRGTRTSRIRDAAPATHEGRIASYDRGAVTETYEVRAEGLEQSFVFHELPEGEGDLVVSVECETPMSVQQTGLNRVEMRNDFGGVDIHGVFGIDALGNRTEGSLSYEKGSLQLRLPGSFVREAVLPLTVDPMINPTIVSSGWMPFSDLARDVALGSDLLIYTNRITVASVEVRGFFVPGGGVLIRAAADVANVSVADNRARTAYVVAWDELFVTNIFGTFRALRVRALRDPATLGAVTTVVSSTSISYTDPKLSSNMVAGDARIMMLSKTSQFGAPAAELRTVTLSASLGATVSTAVTIANNVGVLGIAPSGGAANDYLLGMSIGIAAPYQTIFQHFGIDLAPISPSRPLPGSSSADTVIAIDGDAKNAYAYLLRADIGYLVQISYDQRNGAMILGDLIPAVGGFYATLDSLNVAVTPDSVVQAQSVLYTTRCTSSHVGPCTQNRFQIRTRHGCQTCEPNVDLGLSGTIGLIRPSAYGDSDPAHAELIKMYWMDSSSSSVWGADIRPDDGTFTDLGGGCGGLTARVRAECAHIGGEQYSALLLDLPRSTNSWLVLNTQRRDMGGCGSCVLVPELSSAVVVGPLTASNDGTVQVGFTIPNLQALVGLHVYQQWAVDLRSPPCANLPFALSNALDVQIQ
ncbi:MAG: hypothetical protein U1F36_07615 [Planctomycetota bacterium]